MNNELLQENAALKRENAALRRSAEGLRNYLKMLEQRSALQAESNYDHHMRDAQQTRDVLNAHPLPPVTEPAVLAMPMWTDEELRAAYKAWTVS